VTNAPEAEAEVGTARRLGMFGGVFTPSILTILGVVMYLLLPWVVGNVGLGGALAIIVIAHLISTITGLSVSSIATNRTVGAGGAYYMISRSLGAPAGAAVGIPLFFAQALSVAFYVVGFTESLLYLLPDDLGHPVLNWFINGRVIAIGTIVLLAALALKSAEAAIKVQYVVMGAIGLSLISIFASGVSMTTGDITWFPDAQTKAQIGARPFAEVFAVFFPAVTGIMAGVSMSGDLKDPRKALPRGTMLAILVGFLVYITLPFWVAFNFKLEDLVGVDDRYVVFDKAVWPALVYLGLWGATLSSAVGCILGAPRTLQALAVDGLAPRFLAKGSGAANEPRLGLVVTIGLAVGGVLMGSLDLLAQVLTIFFLATYGFTNLACALERWADSPSFRPTFRVSSLISFVGAVACFYLMSIIDFGAMIAAALICSGIYVIVQRRTLNTTYGDARHGLWSALVRTSLRHLHHAEYHAMNWRPNLLIFGGPSTRRRYLLEMGAAVVQARGITSYVHMLEGEVRDLASQREALRQKGDYLSPEFPSVFFRVDIVPDVYRGIVTITQSYGIGNLEANTVMLGWLKKRERAPMYFQMLNELTLLDNSLVLVDHDELRAFGGHGRIHVWWGGLQGNGGMMLLLAYLIRSSARWQRAQVTTLTVIDHESDRARATQGLQRLFDSARLEAEARVILRDDRSINDIMAAESGDADLTLIGLRLPQSAEEAEGLYDHYSRLLTNLPSTMLVHSAGSVNLSPVLFDDDLPAPTPEEDAATPEEDAATPEEDAATPEEDAATPEEDAATPEEDAATLEEDAATPEEDAATLEEDSATPASSEDSAAPEEAPAGPPSEEDRPGPPSEEDAPSQPFERRPPSAPPDEAD